MGNFARKIKIFTLIGICLTTISLAETSETISCGPFKSTQSVMDCALKKHPRIRIAEIHASKGSALKKIAGQIPNPEVSSKATYGKNLGDTIINMEASLEQKIELGGKRGARKEVAEAETESLEAGLLQTREEVFLNTLHHLYKLRQLKTEISIVEEALTTFSRILKLYRSRPKLSAEQEVSLSIFELAAGEHQMRRSGLQSEFEVSKREIELSIVESFEPTAENLPVFKTEWPQISETQTEAPKSASFKLADAELKRAYGLRSQAKADTWPDLTLGPIVERQKEGGNDAFYSYGGQISLPLPLFNWNGGARNFAEREEYAAKESLQLKKQELQNERSILVRRYINATSALKEAPDVLSLQQKHKRVEKLFDQGVISTSLLIEAHRQIQDFAQAQNEQEHEAADALWKIYALDGRLFEEKL